MFLREKRSRGLTNKLTFISHINAYLMLLLHIYELVCECTAYLFVLFVCFVALHPKSTAMVIFFLFDLILNVPSTIFQLYRDGSSWVEPVLS